MEKDSRQWEHEKIQRIHSGAGNVKVVECDSRMIGR